MEVPKIESWKTDVQVEVYNLLRAWVTEAEESLLCLFELRESLLDVTVYGSYSDRIRAISTLANATEKTIEMILRISGGFETPSQLAATIRRRLEEEEESGSAGAVGEFEGMGSEEQAQVLRLVQGIFADAKQKVLIDGEIIDAKTQPARKRRKRKTE